RRARTVLRYDAPGAPHRALLSRRAASDRSHDVHDPEVDHDVTRHPFGATPLRGAEVGLRSEDVTWTETGCPGRCRPQGMTTKSPGPEERRDRRDDGQR